MEALLLLFALLGHAFLWIGLINRLHALGISRWIIKVGTIGCFVCAALIPIGVGWQYARNPERPITASWGVAFDDANVGLLITTYVVVCWATVLATLLQLVYLRCFRRPPPILRFHGRRRVNIEPASAATARELAYYPLTHLPLNEILQLEATQWVLDVPRLAPALDGLSIVHLSDLHFTGCIGKAYFREVVRVCNDFQPDLVCITGDIIDHPSCFDWIPDTLGQLAARHGVYFILGNHDRLVDIGRLRSTLKHSGLIDLGGRWLPIEIGRTSVMLAGNERPWFNGPLKKGATAGLPSSAWENSRKNTAGQASSGTQTPSSIECAQRTGQSPEADGALHAPYGLRIVLSHTPDQLAWAQAHDADLMLAGHTHGGQVCIPPLGAIFSPTTTGVKYISGVFYAPPTILHVTRGISGDIPVRWHCPPEIAHLRLRAGCHM